MLRERAMEFAVGPMTVSGTVWGNSTMGHVIYGAASSDETASQTPPQNAHEQNAHVIPSRARQRLAQTEVPVR